MRSVSVQRPIDHEVASMNFCCYGITKFHFQYTGYLEKYVREDKCNLYTEENFVSSMQVDTKTDGWKRRVHI